MDSQSIRSFETGFKTHPVCSKHCCFLLHYWWGSTTTVHLSTHQLQVIRVDSFGQFEAIMNKVAMNVGAQVVVGPQTSTSSKHPRVSLFTPFCWLLCLCCPISLSLHLCFLGPSSCLRSAFDSKWHWIYVGVKWIGLFQEPKSPPVLDTSCCPPLQGNEYKTGTCWEWRLSKHPQPETLADFPPSGQVLAT